MAEEHEKEGDGAQMSLIGHLTELRNRLGVALLAFVVLFLITVAPMPGGGMNNSIASHVFIFLQAPLAEILEEKGGGRMIFTALHEGFFTQIKVGFFAALCVTFPILSIQIWKFIAPALYKNEKNAFLPFLIATPVLFALGAAMVYYIVTPMAWNFFVGFEMAGSDGALAIEIEPRISEYLSLIMRLIFAFGLAFELPCGAAAHGAGGARLAGRSRRKAQDRDCHCVRRSCHPDPAGCCLAAAAGVADHRALRNFDFGAKIRGAKRSERSSRLMGR